MHGSSISALMSDQHLSNDVISVIILCADVRTAVSLASTCHSIKLPPLSHWHTVVEDVETSHDVSITSSRSMLRADPPIMHGDTVILADVSIPLIVHYDRGVIMHATTSVTTWLGSRYATIQCGRALISGDRAPCIVTYDDATATVHHAKRGTMNFQSRPDGDSALEILQWYARMVPDTLPALSLVEMLRSILSPIPSWVR